METTTIQSQSAFITQDVLTETQERLKRELLANQKEVKDELSKRMDKGDSNVGKLDDKVDGLTTMVLPLLSFTEATAKNTEKMYVAFDKFAEYQRTTNDSINNRVNTHEVKLEGLSHITSGVVEKKRYNIAVVTAAIGVIGLVVTGVFQLAPVLIPYILK